VALAFEVRPSDPKLLLVSGLVRQVRDAEEREAIRETRPRGCWCLGAGGAGLVAVLGTEGDDGGAPIEVVTEACPACSEGAAAMLEKRRVEAEGSARRASRRLARILGGSAIPDIYLGASLDDPPLSEAQVEAYEAAREWVSRWRERRNLWIYGEVGTGKSRLAVATALRAAELRGCGVLFATPESLLLRVRATFGDRADRETEASILQAVREVDLLILDDLSRGIGTDWAAQTVWGLINARYLYGRRTILTSNVPPSRADAVFREDGEALVSRISEDCERIVLDGEDVRPRAAALRSRP